MKPIDTHVHLDFEQYDEDRPRVIERARLNLSAVINVGVDRASSENSLVLQEEHPGFLYAACGFHPNDSAGMRREDLDWLAGIAREGRIVAVGEIGLDYYRDRSPRDVQLKVFAEQLDLAREVGLPVIVHDREAHEDVLSMLQGHPARGVMHCFSGDWDLAVRSLDLGLYIAIGGAVTFPSNHDLREVAAKVPIERLLIETDCPFLTPVPNRGRRNEPARILDTAAFIAGLRKMSEEEFSRKTAENARVLFRLGGDAL